MMRASVKYGAAAGVVLALLALFPALTGAQTELGAEASFEGQSSGQAGGLKPADTLTAGYFVTDAFGARVTPSAPDDRSLWSGVTLRHSPNGFAPNEISTPSGAPDEIFLRLGEKTLTAGGPTSMAAVVVFDAEGNLAQDGAEVLFNLGPRQVTETLADGIASTRVIPGSQSGAFVAGATSGARQSWRVEYYVQADLPSVLPRLQEATVVLNPETLSNITSLPLFDRFGNPVDDGTGLSLLIQHERAVTVLWAQTLAGRVEVPVLTRDLPNRGRASLSLGDRAARGGVDVQIQPLLAAGPLAVETIELPEIAATRFRIGPFLTDAGHMLNDGAKVTVSITGATGAQDKALAWALDGYVEVSSLLSSRDFPMKVVVSTVLGDARIDVAKADRLELTTPTAEVLP